MMAINGLLETLRSHSAKVTLTIACGTTLNILLGPKAFEGLRSLVEALKEDAQR